MKKYLDKFVTDILNQPVSITGWMMGFLGILFVRFILESLSSPTRNLQIPSNPETLIHYTLFWLTLTLGLILIVGHFIKNYYHSAKLALFGLPIIWSAPFFDIFLSQGKGYYQSYMLDTGKNLLYNFFTFLGPNFTWGATYGIRIEIVIVLMFIGIYLKTIQVKVSKILLCLFIIYTFAFILGSWPAILYTLQNIHQSPVELNEVYKFFYKITANSTISHNTIYEGMNSVTIGRFFELTFDKLASQILFLISCLLSVILFWKVERNTFQVVIQNIRWERVGSYLSLLLAGAGFAYVSNLGKPLVLVDLLGLLCLMISWLSLWMYAVHNNDIQDLEIDKISNKERPLVMGTINTTSMREVGYVWLLASLFGSYCAGFYPFYMCLVCIFSSNIYSNPPLRLRRYPLVPSFLIGICSFATITTGFFFLSISKQVLTFPISLSVGIIIMATLAINVKDMKDIEGDRKNGILTLPILFGKWGVQVVAVCFALSFLLVPVFLSVYVLFIVSVPASIIGYRIVLRKPFREEPVFILRFVFLSLVAIIYIGLLLV